MNGASCAAVHSPVPFADRRSRGDSMELADALRRISGDRADVRDLLQALAKAGNQYRGVARKGVQALEMQVCGYTPGDRRTVRRAQQRGGRRGKPGQADAKKGAYSVCRIKPLSPFRSFSATAYGFFFR